MKTRIIRITLTLIAAILAASCSKNPVPSEKEKTLYTCGMHPLVLQDKPGNCPVCGIPLVPVRQQTRDTAGNSSAPSPGERKIKYYKSTMLPGEISQTPRKDSMGMEMVPVFADQHDDSAIRIDAVTIQKMDVRTAPVVKGPLRRVIRTVGTVDFNETALADVTTKFSGWIEKLDVDSTGKEVRKGEPLFEIYSPELYSAQSEYVLALNQGGGGLKASVRQKLTLYDISEDQIAELEKTGKPRRTLSVRAPIDGVVVEKMAVQGQRAEAGMKLYRLADLSIVWVQSQIYEQDLAYIKLGQEATVSLSYLPDRKFSGRVTFIYPTVDEKTRTARVRMEFHNPGFFLKPGMFATVEIRAELDPSTVLVPDTAVLRSGENNTVFVALTGGRFEPRTVRLGQRSENNTYQVLSGLSEGEQVVTSGQFMLDSESQLREAIEKMLSPSAPANWQEHAPHTRAAATPAAGPEEHTAASQEYVCPEGYSCPLPGHMSITYNHSGKCPICGMTLIPKTPEEGAAPEGATSPQP